MATFVTKFARQRNHDKRPVGSGRAGAPVVFDVLYRSPVKRTFVAMGAIAAVIALLLIGAGVASTASRDQEVVLTTGASGGAFQYVQSQFIEAMRAADVAVDTSPVVQSAQSAQAVQDSEAPANAAIVSMPMTVSDYPDVRNVGTFARLAVVIVVRTSSPFESVADLADKRIDIGIEGSMREALILTILREYGITDDSATFTHNPQAAALSAVRTGLVEAAIAVLDPYDPASSEALRAPGITLLPLPDAPAVAARSGFLTAVTIPRGGFGLSPNPIPASDLETVAAPMSLIVTTDISDGVVYKMAHYLNDTYGTGSITSLPGEFPNFDDRQVPPHPAAAELYATGALPWQYDVMPTFLADVIVPIILFLSLLLLLTQVIAVFLPDTLSLWSDHLEPRRREKALASLEQALADGRELSVKQRRALARILAEQDQERTSRQRAEAMRSVLDERVTDASD